MRKIDVMTFHRAHNFGSVLQAYALQTFVEKLHQESHIDMEYTLIDFFTPEQEELYRIYKKCNCLQNIIKNLIAFRYAKQLKSKYRKFNTFIEKYFNLTKRYYNEMELVQEPPKADYYLSGSDQIWNVRARDYSIAYYLNFVDDGKKVSYAASLGPMKIDWSKYSSSECANALQKYTAVSVREQGSLDNIQTISDIKCDIHVDPTMLLTADEWRKIQSYANYNDGQYILLYCLEPSKEQLRIADTVSKKLKLPVVILRYNNKNDMFNHFVKKYDSGPADFLAYIDHAALVLSSSFHGTVFSLIFHKPFYSLNGLTDNRISSILRKTNMLDRSLENIADAERVSLIKPSSSAIENLLEEERMRSREYLMKVLEIE